MTSTRSPLGAGLATASAESSSTRSNRLAVNTQFSSALLLGLPDPVEDVPTPRHEVDADAPREREARGQENNAAHGSPVKVHASSRRALLDDAPSAVRAGQGGMPQFPPDDVHSSRDDGACPKIATLALSASLGGRTDCEREMTRPEWVEKDTPVGSRPGAVR